MSLWGPIDQANNAPKSAVAGGLGISANGQSLFGNTQNSAYVQGMSIGTFGVDAAEAAVAGEGKKVAHAGWNLRKAGSGPVIQLSISNPGANYSTNGFITFYSTTGTGANASYTVNAVSKTIATVTLVSGGSGYVTTPTATAANSTGVNSASFIVTMGGRANRVHYETLVAMGSISNDAEDIIFPDI